MILFWFILRMIDKSFIENMHKVAKIFSFLYLYSRIFCNFAAELE